MAHLASVALVCLLSSMAIMHVGGQAADLANNNSITFWSLSFDDKVMNLAQYLAGNDFLTRKLFNIGFSLRWLLDATNGSPMGNQLMPAILDLLPGVFGSNFTKLVTYTVMDELQMVDTNSHLQEFANISGYILHLRPLSAEFNKSVQDQATNYMLNNANWLRVVQRVLSYSGARDLLFEVSPNRTTVSKQCYQHTMDFLDAVLGAKNLSQPKPLEFEQFMWAFKMLDTFGKVSSGIFKGNLHFLGMYDECLDVHAYLRNDANMSLGGRPHNYVTEFDTHLCRATFSLPQSLIDSFGVDTRGITLRLHWDMCLPNTCSNEDVTALFRLGLLAPYNISVYNVYCGKEDNVKSDAKAIVAIVILAIFAAIVVLSTLYEAWLIFYHNNFVKQDTSFNPNSIEDPRASQGSQPEHVYVNAAYQVDGTEKAGENGQLPEKSHTKGEKSSAPVVSTGYVHHREVIPTYADDTKRVNGEGVNPTPPPAYSERDKEQLGRHAAAGRQPEVCVPKIVKAFSLLSNMPKILNGRRTPNAIHCLHGIRVLSMLWILLGHTYNYGVISVIDNPTTVNLVDADAIFKRFTFQGIQAAGYSVDTFFLLSGFLVTLLTLRDLGKNKLSPAYLTMYYVHRFWRLTPVYMIVLMTFACLHTYLGGGPLWPENLPTAADCHKNWWTNLLYVNNLVNVDNPCMGWTWYLANDMQFYWIAPLFIIPLFFLAPLGLVMTICLGLAGIGASFSREYHYGGDLFTTHEDLGFWDEVYIKPWCRVAAYVVGMVLGYLFSRKSQQKLSLSTSIAGWLLCGCVGFTLCYVTYSARREGGKEWPRGGEAFYEAFGRPMWAACVGWIIYACHNNRGGFVNSFLSWEGFLPLSRLTYAAYLIHPVIMMLHVFSKRALIYIDDYEMTYLFIGHTVVTFLAAFVFSVVVEAPSLALEKLIFRLR